MCDAVMRLVDGRILAYTDLGAPTDLPVQGRPWQFDPASITAATVVLHGVQDPYVPVAHGRHTAEVISGARFVLLPR